MPQIFFHISSLKEKNRQRLAARDLLSRDTLQAKMRRLDPQPWEFQQQLKVSPSTSYHLIQVYHANIL